jgi:hypothetical protein
MCEVDACRFCGDPQNCDDSCEVDRVRQERQYRLLEEDLFSSFGHMVTSYYKGVHGA